MPMFYCTVGWKDGKQGYVQPIEAESEDEARRVMFAMRGGDWCTSYTEERWLEFVRDARMRGWLVEPEVPLVRAIDVLGEKKGEETK